MRLLPPALLLPELLTAQTKVLVIGDSLSAEYEYSTPFSAPDSDELDADTLNALAEMALGTNPLVSNPPPALQPNGPTWQLTFTPDPTASRFVQTIPEESTNLQLWTPIPPRPPHHPPRRHHRGNPPPRLRNLLPPPLPPLPLAPSPLGPRIFSPPPTPDHPSSPTPHSAAPPPKHSPQEPTQPSSAPSPSPIYALLSTLRLLQPV